NDLDQLERAMESAIGERQRPSLIVVDSHIAYGAPHKQDTSGAHGEPLGEDEIRGTKERYGWDADKHFYVPDQVQARINAIRARGADQESTWNAQFADYKKAFPELAAELEHIHNAELPAGWDATIPVFPADDKGMAGRDASAQVLNAVAQQVPWIIGG